MITYILILSNYFCFGLVKLWLRCLVKFVLGSVEYMSIEVPQGASIDMYQTLNEKRKASIVN